jgi:LPPG:FO 2-phospho-L-lactate transferase
MTAQLGQSPRVLAISGGVGGAKLALGLANVLADDDLQVLANTADDFQHLGLHISPDIDTLLYTLAGLSNQSLGWGLEGETWQAMDALERLGGDTWFRLGDRDLATHLWRSQLLAQGESLSSVTTALAARLGVACSVYPMSDDPVRTVVDSDEGPLPFQHYFVRRQCEPAVRGFHFEGLEQARPNTAVLELLRKDAFDLIVICPSNPFVSVDPVLQLGGLWQTLQACRAPVVAVSPIVAGMAIKGPAAKMMDELQVPVTAAAVAQHYQQRYPGLLNHFVIDHSDVKLQAEIEQSGVAVSVTATIMKSLQDKQGLARFVLGLSA